MMQGSLFLGHLGPIPLYAHWSSLILLFMAVNFSGASTATGIACTVMVLILSIVLHEMGHGMAARAVARNEAEKSVTITLWAFGGVCMSIGSHQAWPRLFVVLAGPAVSLALWIAAALLILSMKQIPIDVWGGFVLSPFQLFHMGMNEADLFQQILATTMLMNFGLLVFNMLPIYPFDGGQALFNGLKLFGLDYDLCRKMTFAISVAAVAGYVAYRYQATGQIDIYLLAIMAWSLYVAYTHLFQQS